MEISDFILKQFDLSAYLVEVKNKNNENLNKPSYAICFLDHLRAIEANLFGFFKNTSHEPRRFYYFNLDQKNVLGHAEFLSKVVAYLASQYYSKTVPKTIKYGDFNNNFIFEMDEKFSDGTLDRKSLSLADYKVQATHKQELDNHVLNVNNQKDTLGPLLPPNPDPELVESEFQLNKLQLDNKEFQVQENIIEEIQPIQTIDHCSPKISYNLTPESSVPPSPNSKNCELTCDSLSDFITSPRHEPDQLEPSTFEYEEQIGPKTQSETGELNETFGPSSEKISDAELSVTPSYDQKIEDTKRVDRSRDRHRGDKNYRYDSKQKRDERENQTITCSMKCFGNGKLVSCADLQADEFPIYGSFDKSQYVIKDAKTGENVEWKQI